MSQRPECNLSVTAVTHTGNLEQVPELPLSLDLHLHHRVVGVLDALQGLLDAWEQVNDLLLANQDLTVEGEEGRRGVWSELTLAVRRPSHRGDLYLRWV